MRHTRMVCFLALGTASACGGGAGGDGEDCDSVPRELQVTNVSPAPGETVSGPVVHRLTVVAIPVEPDDPGDFAHLGLIQSAEHESGDATPDDPDIQGIWRGSNVEFVWAPMRWAETGRVVLSYPRKFEGSDGCLYVLPEPLFDYEVEE